MGVVDWVLVQVRIVPNGSEPPRNAANKIVSKAGLLLSDGSIVDADNPTGGVLSIEDLAFDDATEDLYIAIKHRNHVPILSQRAASENEGVYGYEFASSSDIQGGVTAYAVRGGVVSMRAGDSDGDSNVEAGTDVDNFVSSFGDTGYLPADANLDGNVESGADVDTFSTPNNGRGQQFIF